MGHHRVFIGIFQWFVLRRVSPKPFRALLLWTFANVIGVLGTSEFTTFADTLFTGKRGYDALWQISLLSLSYFLFAVITGNVILLIHQPAGEQIGTAPNPL